MRRGLLIGYVGVSLLLGGAPVLAVPITFEFTGTVTQVPVLDPGDPFGGTIGFGTAFHGRYTFESTTPDAVPSPQIGAYRMSGAPFGASVTLAGHTFSTTDALAIGVADNLPGPRDQYTVLACAGGLSCAGDLTLELFFEDPTGTVFSSDALPLIPPALTRFATRDFHLSALVEGNQVQIDGRVESLSCPACAPAPVPEPSALLLLATALAGLALRRRP